MSNEAHELLKQRMIKAEADVYEIRKAAMRVMKEAYANPTAAFAKMCRFEGTDASLIKRIQDDPAWFGTLLGYRSVGEYFSIDGMKLRAMSAAIAKEVPDLIHKLTQAEHKYFDLKGAYEGRDASLPSLTRGRGDFNL